MTNLSVNVNKIAWLRNARGGNTPDIIELSELIIDCGVSSITVHPRPDLRHITPDDVYKLRELTISKDVEFNIVWPHNRGYYRVIKFNFFANLFMFIDFSNSNEIIPPKTVFPFGFFCCFLAIECCGCSLRPG